MRGLEVVIVAAVLVLTACKGDSSRHAAALLASTDDPLAVHLEWTVEGTGHTGFAVFRDGELVAEVPATARSYEDVGAAEGRLSAPRLMASRGTHRDGVQLTWSAPEREAGPAHWFRVDTLYGSDHVPSNEAKGNRAAPSVLSYALERDGVALASVEGDSLQFTDSKASPAQPAPPRFLSASSRVDAVELTWEEARPIGPAHAYAISATHELGRSEKGTAEGASGGGVAPVAYEVFRAGAAVGEVTADGPLVFLDRDVEPAPRHRPADLSASQGEFEDQIILRWSSPPGVGRNQDYRVEAVYPGGHRERSDTVQGAAVAPKPSTYVVFGDGEELETLPEGSSRWADRRGEPERLPPPGDFRTTGHQEYVTLRWSPPVPRAGERRTYQVAAIYGEDEPLLSNRVEGYLAAPRITGYAIEYEGERKLVSVSATSVTDWEIEPGRATPPGNFQATTHRTDGVLLTWEPSVPLPGPTRRYRILATWAQGDGMPSEAVEGSRAEPKYISYLINGPRRTYVPIGVWFGVTNGLVPANHTHTHPPTFLRASNDREDGVMLEWLASQQDDYPYPDETFEIAAVVSFDGVHYLYPGGSATGNVRTPAILRYEVLRDGKLLAEVGPEETTFLDAEAWALGPPVDLTASDRTDVDGVTLNWSAPASGAPVTHSYWIRVVDDATYPAASRVLEGSRAPQAIVGYEFSRGLLEPWLPAGSGTSYKDTEASYGTIRTSYSTRLLEPHGEVRLSNGNSSVHSPAGAGYRVRAVTADGHGQPSMPATGRRKVVNQVTSIWQVSPTGEEGSFIDVPDPHAGGETLGVGEVRWYRLQQEAPGARTTHAATRLERQAFASIAAASSLTCGITVEGELRCWGSYSDSIASVPKKIGPYDSVAVGRSVVAARYAQTQELDWNGSYPAGMPVEAVNQVAVGPYHNCRIRSADNRVLCDGADNFGQSNPPSSFFDYIAVGKYASCGIEQNGALSCWGQVPVGVPSGTFDSVAVGEAHACALGAGSLTCWGDDAHGNAVPVGTDFEKVSVRGDSSCAMTAAGLVECWGGLSDPPVNGSFVDVAVGSTDRACGVVDTGEVVCWGTSSAIPGGH